jgi:hypothetical protein
MSRPNVLGVESKSTVANRASGTRQVGRLAGAPSFLGGPCSAGVRFLAHALALDMIRIGREQRSLLACMTSLPLLGHFQLPRVGKRQTGVSKSRKLLSRSEIWFPAEGAPVGLDSQPRSFSDDFPLLQNSLSAIESSERIWTHHCAASRKCWCCI